MGSEWRWVLKGVESEELLLLGMSLATAGGNEQSFLELTLG
jgi:hypothetical protein